MEAPGRLRFAPPPGRAFRGSVPSASSVAPAFGRRPLRSLASPPLHALARQEFFHITRIFIYNNRFLDYIFNNIIYIGAKTMDIKGTQTEKNLQTAFAGESQARNKYT